MREVLRWSARQPRVWLSLAAAATAIVLAVDDGRSGWTGFVATLTTLLAALSIRERYDADHAGDTSARAEREQAKERERVDAILWRYERQRRARERDEERR